MVEQEAVNFLVSGSTPLTTARLRVKAFSGVSTAHSVDSSFNKPSEGKMRKGQKLNLNKKAFLYITKNLINGKVYIGVRTFSNTSTDNKYLGSGKAIKKAIEKYGKENFSRNTLLIGSTKYCYEVEREIVNEDWCKSEDNYNISVGGWGGDRGREFRENMSKVQKKLHDNKTPEEKEERRQWLISINSPDSIPSGKDSPNWRGYWLTPKGRFETCRQAAQSNNIEHRTLRNRCLYNNHKEIPRKREGIILKEWVGFTWNELGWGFEPAKEVKDEQ